MQDKMLRVAVIEGGYSKEKDISVKSAQGVFENLDLSKYLPTRVYIDDVEWTAYDADGRYPINKNDFSFIHKDNIKITFDVAFILVHGTPGEDGKLQGYFDMIGIPYTTSSAVVTTLAFHKFYVKQFIRSLNLANVAEAVLVKRGETVNDDEVLMKIGLPCFVLLNQQMVAAAMA
uniref:D-alanine--D-alanine ligase N-terminal domain-containing protein n=1 Tax=Clytia hemisphaerica TaxID=252671 RepID=A0A7M5WU03_9CNID